MTVFCKKKIPVMNLFTNSVIIPVIPGLDPDLDGISSRVDPDPYSEKYLDPEPVSGNTDPKHCSLHFAVQAKHKFESGCDGLFISCLHVLAFS